MLTSVQILKIPSPPGSAMMCHDDACRHWMPVPASAPDQGTWVWNWSWSWALYCGSPLLLRDGFNAKIKFRCVWKIYNYRWSFHLLLLNRQIWGKHEHFWSFTLCCELITVKSLFVLSHAMLTRTVEIYLCNSSYVWHWGFRARVCFEAVRRGSLHSQKKQHDWWCLNRFAASFGLWITWLVWFDR